MSQVLSLTTLGRSLIRFSLSGIMAVEEAPLDYVALQVEFPGSQGVNPKSQQPGFDCCFPSLGGVTLSQVAPF